MKSKSFIDKISDATEILCVIILVVFIWSSAIFLVAVGIYALFNLF